jgi:hypothetical protein
VSLWKTLGLLTLEEKFKKDKCVPMIGTPSVPTVGTHLKKVPKSKKREESNIA